MSDGMDISWGIDDEDPSRPRPGDLCDARELDLGDST